METFITRAPDGTLTKAVLASSEAFRLPEGHTFLPAGGEEAYGAQERAVREAGQRSMVDARTRAARERAEAAWIKAEKVAALETKLGLDPGELAALL